MQLELVAATLNSVRRCRGAARSHADRYLSVMFGPEIAKSHTRELQQNANDAFTALLGMPADAGVTDDREARRFGTVIWSFVHGLASLTVQSQVPSSVGETPDGLATLGLTSLFRSFRAKKSGPAARTRRR